MFSNRLVKLLSVFTMLSIVLGIIGTIAPAAIVDAGWGGCLEPPSQLSVGFSMAGEPMDGAPLLEAALLLEESASPWALSWRTPWERFQLRVSSPGLSSALFLVLSRGSWHGGSRLPHALQGRN
jgi:hypothetical protein